MKVMNYLEESGKEFLAAIDGVTEEQWKWKPAPERWSVGETAEHIVLAEALLFGNVQKAIASQPNPDGATEFSADLLAQWETYGATHSILGYVYQQTQINGRNAAVIRQPRNHMVVITAHLISAQRILQVDCVPGADDQDIYVPACDATVFSIKLDPSATPPLPPGDTAPIELRRH